MWHAWFGYSPQSLLWVSACSAYTMSDVCGAPPLTFHSQPVVARYCQSLKKHRTPKRTAKSTCVNASQDVYAEKNGKTQKQTKAQIAKVNNVFPSHLLRLSPPLGHARPSLAEYPNNCHDFSQTWLAGIDVHAPLQTEHWLGIGKMMKLT